MRGTARAERGEVMITTVVFLVALLAASVILVSASEQWEARRKAAAAAATMARAAAQGDPELIRATDIAIDPARAAVRADDVLTALNAADDESDYRGRLVGINGSIVTVEVTTSVDYTFAVPGFPDRIVGSAQAEAVRGGG